MIARRPRWGRILLLAAALGLAGPARAEPPPPAALVKALLAAPGPEVPAAEAALRTCGAGAAAALRAARNAAAPEGRARIDRVLAALTEDLHRRSTPAGMVYVPAGPLELPCDAPPWGPSGRRAQVGAFYLDRTEVTIGAWRAWLARLEAAQPGAVEEAGLTVPPAEADARLPVAGVPWAEAERYAREARGGRLPSAEEFERAVRGAGVALWPWGGASPEGRANLAGHGPGAAVVVGTHPAGEGPFGCVDLVGNVAEWSSTIVRQGRSGRYPLLLGGSFHQRPDPALTWRGLGRMEARVAPRERLDWVGVRVARDVPDLPE